MDTFDMNTPGAPAGASGDGNGGAAHQSAEEEVQFLRRKIKYLQSVSTVFRQKVALILRDVKRDPAGRFNDFERNYNAAVTEITQAELTEFGYDGTPLPAGGYGLAGPPNGSGRGGGEGAFGNIPGSPFAAEVLRYQRARASRDDIKKTHHLCTILQEKNEIKAREVSLRKKCETLQQNYDELEERFTKFVELQASGAGPQAAQQEIWEKREQSLQKEIVTLKTEIARLKTGEPQTIIYEDAVVGDATLAKQNQMLKARLQRAKEEAAQAQKRGSESASELQGSLDSLIEQIHSLRSQLAERDNNIAVMTKQRNELAKELVTTRSQLELHSARAASLEKQQEDRIKAKNEDGTLTTRGGGGGDDTNKGIVAGESIYGRDLDVAQKRIRTLEQEVEHLTEKVAHEMNLNREKEIKMESLGNQIQHLRKRIDTQAAGKEQREGQKNTLNELEGRLLTALQDMQSSQLTVTMTQQMSTITEKLKQLEHVELQLRQKEDELTIAKDEAKGAKNQMDQMKRALQSISTMYMKFPQSAAQLERMIIELEEHKAEMQRCASDRDIPDMVRLSGVIDLRCMDAQGSKPLAVNTGLGASAANTVPGSSKLLADHSAALSSGDGGDATGTHYRDPESILLDTTTGGGAAAVDPTGTTIDPETAALDDSDLLVGSNQYDRELFQELPPPPALISSASVLSGAGGSPAAVHRSMSATPGETSGSALGGGGGGGGSSIADGDARLTFQLFDEKGEGRLPVDTIRLCLTTLGLPTRLIPPHTKNMSLTEFVALCSTAN